MPAAGLTEADYIQTILDTIAGYEQSQAAKPEPKLRTKLILSVRPPLTDPSITQQFGGDDGAEIVLLN